MNDPFHISLSLETPDQTAKLAAKLAPLLGAGDCLLLSGQIGAGKTHFSRALIQARLAAVDLLEDVPSPTFTLVQVYDDTVQEIWHADLYRLSDPLEIVELGLDQAFLDAITIVEWPEMVPADVQRNALRIQFETGPDEASRMLTFQGDATRWSKVLHLLSASTGPLNA